MWKYALLCALIASVGNGQEEENDEPVDKKAFVPRTFEQPKLDLDSAIFAELFNSRSAIGKPWKVSNARKEGIDEELAKYNGVWAIAPPSKPVLVGDLGLVAQSAARHHAIAAPLPQPLDFSKHDTIVVQYEVKYTEGQECGGGYLKLLNEAEDAAKFNDKSAYTIMFGPDKCGMDKKVHFIVRIENPKNKTVFEHHAPQPKNILDFTDKATHHFKLVLKRDNSYAVYLDNKSIYSGSLLKDLVPSVQPPTQVADSNDHKPADWDDVEMIVDPTASKPDDHDESAPEVIVDEDAKMPSDWIPDQEALMPDLKAVKPDDWDNEMDGKWAAPLVANPACDGISGCGKWTQPTKKNPAYKGKWVAPKIKNPNYKGVWAAQLIDNPNYYTVNPYAQLQTVTAIGFELWTISPNIVFDNIFIGDDEQLAADFATQTFGVKSPLEVELNQAENPTKGVFDGLIEATEDKPWMWAIYAACILVPIAALVYFMTRKSSTPTADDTKKTDAYQPDDDAAADLLADEDDESAVPSTSAVAEEDVSEAPVENSTSSARKRGSTRARKSKAKRDEAENADTSS